MVLVFVAVKYEYSCLSVNICLVVVAVVFCSCYGCEGCLLALSRESYCILASGM